MAKRKKSEPSEAQTQNDPPAEPKLRQTEIPGTERPKIKAIDEAAEIYCDLRDKMQKAVQKFKEAKEKLRDLMHKNAEKVRVADGSGQLVYKYDDMMVQVIPKDEQIKVKHVDEDVTVGEVSEDRTEGEA